MFSDPVHLPGQLQGIQGPDRRQVLRRQGDRGQGLCLRQDQLRGQVPRQVPPRKGKNTNVFYPTAF